MAHTQKATEDGWREDAIKALRKIKKSQEGKVFKMVRVGTKTWKEVEVK